MSSHARPPPVPPPPEALQTRALRPLARRLARIEATLLRAALGLLPEPRRRR